MKLQEDQEKFEKQQDYIAQLIAYSLKEEFEKRNFDNEIIKEMTADLTFSICCIIDGSTQAEEILDKLDPILTFKKNDKELICSGDTSYMHDTVYDWVYDLFHE